MKKNANIVAYMKKYKEKYAIHYAEEGSKLVKYLSILAGIVWCYSFFWMALSTLSFALNFKMNVLDFANFKRVFIITTFCTVAMIGASVLFVCKQKIAGLILAIVAQPFIYFTYKPMLVYGMGYRPRFYFAYAIPAVLMVIVCGILLFILIRAIYKTNMIYNYIVEELYKQYGTKNGETLSEEQWDEFLTNYNPYKPLVFSETNDDNLEQQENSDIALTDTKCKNALQSFIRLEWAENIRKKLLAIPIIGRILSIVFVVIIWSLCITIIPVIFIGIFILLSNIHKLLAIIFVIIAIDVFSFCTSYVWKYTKKTFFYLCLLVTIPVIVLVLSLIFM